MVPLSVWSIGELALRLLSLVPVDPDNGSVWLSRFGSGFLIWTVATGFNPFVLIPFSFLTLASILGTDLVFVGGFIVAFILKSICEKKVEGRRLEKTSEVSYFLMSCNLASSCLKISFRRLISSIVIFSSFTSSVSIFTSSVVF